MKSTIRIMTMLALAAFTLALNVGCDKSDDVNEIFGSGQRFKITGITYNGIKSVKEVSEFYAGSNVYWIAFNTQSLQGMLQAGTRVEGTWKADGKSHTMTIRINSPQSDDGMSELCRMVFNILRNTAYYSGDSNVIRLYKSNDTYIDLSSLE